MVKYLGALVLLIGAILLILTHFVPDHGGNGQLGLGLVLVIGGYLGHIFLNKAVRK